MKKVPVVNRFKIASYIWERYRDPRLLKYTPVVQRAIRLINGDQVHRDLRIMGLTRQVGDVVDMFDCWHFVVPILNQSLVSPRSKEDTLHLQIEANKEAQRC